MGKKIRVSRRFALKMGHRYYCTGEPCSNGHFAERYAKTGHCVDCVKTRNGKRIRRVSNSLT